MEPVGTDFSADIFTSGRITPGVPVTGTVGISGDQDWFAVTLEAGHTYLIQQEGMYTGKGTITDPYLYGVYGPTGVICPGIEDYDGDVGFNSLLTFAASVSGTHFLAAGGYANDTGSYTLTIDARADLTGTAGNDWLLWQPDTLSVDGGAGSDTLSFVNAPDGVRLRLWADDLDYIGAGDADYTFYYTNEPLVNAITGIEHLTGTSFADTFEGGVAGARFRGMAGDDQFLGENAGAVRYDGGAGRDIVDYGFSTNFIGVSASLLRGRGWAGAAAGDRFVFVENLSGTVGNDSLTGDHGRNILHGSVGDDVLMGNGGNDTLYGDLGRDVAIFGHARAEYDITYLNSHFLRVSHVGVGSHDGIDLLVSIEVLRFADGDVIL